MLFVYEQKNKDWEIINAAMFIQNSQCGRDETECNPIVMTVQEQLVDFGFLFFYLFYQPPFHKNRDTSYTCTMKPPQQQTG